jgi:hypothetical protein
LVEPKLVLRDLSTVDRIRDSCDLRSVTPEVAGSSPVAPAPSLALRSLHGSVADATRAKGVDRARFLTTIRPLRTGLGLRNHMICGPSFSLLRADLLPQPPADVRTCRDRLRLCLRVPAGGCSRGCRWADTDSARSDPRGSEADRRRARGRDRRQSGRSAVSMGRFLARRRLRLLRARLLGVRAAGH